MYLIIIRYRALQHTIQIQTLHKIYCIRKDYLNHYTKFINSILDKKTDYYKDSNFNYLIIEFSMIDDYNKDL